MGKCKKGHSDRFRHNQGYPGIIQAYSERSGILVQNHGISGTQTYSEPEAYSEPWHFHNIDLFKTPVYSRRWHIQNLRHIRNPLKYLRCSVLRKQLTVITIFINYNYFRSISLPRCLLHEINIMNFFKKGLIFTPVVVILCKKLQRARGPDGEFFIYLQIYSNKLAYFQLITVLVQRNSPPKSHQKDCLNFQQKP